MITLEANEALLLRASGGGRSLNATETKGPQRVNFWSRVTWPRSQGVVIFVGVPIAFFIGGLCYAGPRYGIVYGLRYGLVLAAIMLPGALMSWILQRVLKAWAEWPSERVLVTWLKAAVRYLLTDSEPRQRRPPVMK